MAEITAKLSKMGSKTETLPRSTIFDTLSRMKQEGLIIQNKDKSYSLKSTDPIARQILGKFLEMGGRQKLDELIPQILGEDVDVEQVKNQLVFNGHIIQRNDGELVLGVRGAKLMNVCPVCMKEMKSEEGLACLETTIKIKFKSYRPNFSGWDFTYIHAACAIKQELEQLDLGGDVNLVPVELCHSCSLPLSPTILLQTCTPESTDASTLNTILRFLSHEEENVFYKPKKTTFEECLKSLDENSEDNSGFIMESEITLASVERFLYTLSVKAKNEDEVVLYKDENEIKQRAGEIFYAALTVQESRIKERREYEGKILERFYGFAGVTMFRFHPYGAETIFREFPHSEDVHVIPANQRVIPIIKEGEYAFHPRCFKERALAKEIIGETP
jgi:hypothetical protein